MTTPKKSKLPLPASVLAGMAGPMFKKPQDHSNRPSTKGVPKSEAHKAAIAAAARGRKRGPHNEAHKAAIAKAMRGNQNAAGHSVTSRMLGNLKGSKKQG